MCEQGGAATARWRRVIEPTGQLTDESVCPTSLAKDFGAWGRRCRLPIGPFTASRAALVGLPVMFRL